MVAISEIILDDRYIEPFNGNAVLEKNSYMVLQLTTWGLYARNELPICAIQCADFSYYLAAVVNGGHQSFIDVLAQEPSFVAARLSSIRSVLLPTTQTACSAIFEEFYRFYNNSPRVKESIGSWGFGEADPNLASLDSRFFSCDERQLTNEIARQLTSYPAAKAVPWNRYDQEIAALIRLNSLASERIRVWDAHERGRVEDSKVYKELLETIGKRGVNVERLILPGDYSIVHEGKGCQGFHLETNHGWVLVSHNGYAKMGDYWIVLRMPQRDPIFEVE